MCLCRHSARIIWCSKMSPVSLKTAQGFHLLIDHLTPGLQGRLTPLQARDGHLGHAHRHREDLPDEHTSTEQRESKEQEADLRYAYHGLSASESRSAAMLGKAGATAIVCARCPHTAHAIITQP